MWCPNCGGWIWFGPSVGEEIVCKHCGATLARRFSLSGIFGEIEVVGDTGLDSDYKPLYADRDRDDAVSAWKEKHRALEPQVRGGIEERRCSNCNSVIAIPDAMFCPNCGASLQARAKGAATATKEVKTAPSKRTSPKGQELEDCTVCGLELKPSDDVVWCPHCGRLAHRNHLTEWVRTKKSCPSCGESLDENYYR
ncbi:MAG: RING finger protein [Promethearchaeati archaeon SRVP18_Atabeyarchaeia-1]